MNMRQDDPKQTSPVRQNYEEKQDLEDIDRRVRELRGKHREPSRTAKRLNAQPGSNLGLAFRVGVELVSALVVGVIIGWSLDYWLDTRPWIMLVFFLLGGAAGVLNVFRLVSGPSNATVEQNLETDDQDHQAGSSGQ